MTAGRFGLGLGALVLALGYVAFVKLDTGYGWGRIGIALAFAGVVVGLLADQLAWWSQQWIHSDTASLPSQDHARATAPVFRAVATALVIVGAAYQLAGDPGDGGEVVIADFNEPYESPYLTPKHGKKTLVPARLDGTLQKIHERMGVMSGAMGCVDLLVKACPKKPCMCDPPYQRVPYQLDWDLKGLQGIPMVLCQKPKSCFTR